MEKTCDASVEDRMEFVQKVFGILSVQLLFMTAVMASFMAYQTEIHNFLQNHSHIACGVFMVTFIVWGVCMFSTLAESVATNYPLNYVLLSLWTVAHAVILGFLASFFTLDSVLLVFGLTGFAVLALTAYAMETESDYIAWQFGLISVAILFCLVAILNYTVVLSGRVELMLCLVGSVLFSLLIIFDVQMIMTELPPESFIQAIITLHLDIMMLFMRLLILLGIGHVVAAVTGNDSERRADRHSTSQTAVGQPVDPAPSSAVVVAAAAETH